jgi:hypothetical protein
MCIVACIHHINTYNAHTHTHTHTQTRRWQCSLQAAYIAIHAYRHTDTHKHAGGSVLFTLPSWPIKSGERVQITVSIDGRPFSRSSIPFTFQQSGNNRPASALRRSASISTQAHIDSDTGTPASQEPVQASVDTQNEEAISTVEIKEIVGASTKSVPRNSPAQMVKKGGKKQGNQTVVDKRDERTERFAKEGGGRTPFAYRIRRIVEEASQQYRVDQ